MAGLKKPEIEQCLRRICREAIAKAEDVTLKVVRSRAESELGLEAGFLKSDAEWKSRSKIVVEKAFEEGPSEEAKPATNRMPETKLPASQVTTSKSPVSSKAETQSSKAAPAKSNTPKTVSSTSNKASEKKQAEESASDGSSSGSEEESGSEASDSKGKESKSPKQVNGVKRKASQQSSSNESESETDSSGEEEEEHARPKKKSKTNTTSESSSDEQSEEPSESKPQSGQDPLPTQTKSFAAIPSAAFTPPDGYTPVEPALLQRSTPLTPASLAGKQIWHITAPSHLSLSSLNDLSLAALRSGNHPVITQDGAEYLCHETHAVASTLLLPTETGYRPLEQPIARSLQFQRKVRLPHLGARQAEQSAGSSAAAVVRAPPVTTARPQPRGLRMRFKLPGSGPGRPGMLGSESESEGELGGGHASQVDVAEAVAGEAKKKAKKRRSKDDDGQVDGMSRTESLVDGVTQPTPSKEDRKKHKRDRKESKSKVK